MNSFDTSLSRGLLLGAGAAAQPKPNPVRTRSRWLPEPSPYEDWAERLEQYCLWILLVAAGFSVCQAFLT